MFGHVVLLDELNRTPPRTQSALLESMDEQQVTVDGQTWPLPEPHLVLATQNPVGQLGTFPLVESQLDRFALCATVGYPDAETEAGLTLHDGGRDALAVLRPVCSVAEWAARDRRHRRGGGRPRGRRLRGGGGPRPPARAAGVRLGASPRASIALVRAAQAQALVSGRGYVDARRRRGDGGAEPGPPPARRRRRPGTRPAVVAAGPPPRCAAPRP